ncbi:hypothetical protein [Sediminibacterium soli]|uniref:hypothetical protein n=1 Tax=Sediminibacterium soli TaxID=2698829 RepID=UPI00137B31A4|nr:hypothetical protein [Sediminibacterium soli]NCI45577.1 hypothetical protein [Sediminibacterium soli]
MKPILFYVFGFILTAFACSSSKKAGSSAIRQGIAGRVTQVSGNRMPGEGATPAAPNAVRTRVFVYEPTTLAQVARPGDAPIYTAIHTKQVASVETDSTGAFTVALPVGSYSLFIGYGEQWYANLFDTANTIALFRVQKKKLTTANLVIRTRATY